jgi:hypothetical protein
VNKRDACRRNFLSSSNEKNGDISLKYELVFNKKKQLQERNRRPQMREEPLMTHDQIVTKWMENPDF